MQMKREKLLLNNILLRGRHLPSEWHKSNDENCGKDCFGSFVELIPVKFEPEIILDVVTGK